MERGFDSWSTPACWACLTPRCCLISARSPEFDCQVVFSPSYHASHWMEITCACVYITVSVCVCGFFVLGARVWDYTASGKDTGVVEPWMRISSSNTLSLAAHEGDGPFRQDSRATTARACSHWRIEDKGLTNMMRLKGQGRAQEDSWESYIEILSPL